MKINNRHAATALLTLAITLALSNAAIAQTMQHGTMPMEQSGQSQDHSAHQVPAAKPAPPKKPVTPAKKPEAEMDHAAMGHAMPSTPPAMQGMDHSQMGHAAPASTNDAAQPAMQGMDHSQMDQPAPKTGAEPGMQGMDHSQMGHDTAAAPEPAMQSMEGMDHSQMGHASPAPTQPRTPIPEVTDADRKAAIAPDHAHPVHDNGIKSYVLFNRLETWDADPGTGLGWEGQAWIGTDLDRIWLRSEGERSDGQTESADLEVLYGRSVSTWWDVVAGVRHDFKPGASQNFAAIGVQGLAPMKFEMSATAYLGEGGQTAANVEAEYELLLTNRWILQPLVEVTAYGKNDPLRGIGSGLSTAEAGLRLRYEFTRRFAPYIGVVYERAFGNTADMRREHAESFEDTRLVIGLRTWF